MTTPKITHSSNTTHHHVRGGPDKLRLRQPRQGCYIISVCFYLFFLWRLQSFLRSINPHSTLLDSLLLKKNQEGGRGKQQDDKAIDDDGIKDLPESSKGRFIVFVPLEQSQGYGNIMAGLLAAHLLGQEFKRTVCLTSQMSSFLQAFEPTDPLAVEKCPKLLEKIKQYAANHMDRDISNEKNSVSLINYFAPPNECALKKMMMDPKLPIIFMRANTYPRWPSVPDNFFYRFYKARPSFIRLLPYHTPPETVVHLRMEDGISDPRKGLDTKTFSLLGELLPRGTTYLVTNYVPWFDYFETNFQWRHPHWSKVTHSAGVFTKDWGTRETVKTDDSSQMSKESKLREAEAIVRAHKNLEKQFASDDKARQDMQLWIDWYTILRAKNVYHTHSDFSISAIHFMNIRNAKSIEGVVDDDRDTDAAAATVRRHDDDDADVDESNRPKLVLLEESWRRDGESVPLLERKKKGTKRTQLKRCDAGTSTMNEVLAVIP